MNRALRAAAYAVLLVLASGTQAWSQTDPALQVAVEKVFASYLEEGPRKTELNNGPALAAWAIVNRMAIPDFLAQPDLRKGNWRVLWEPVRTVLEDRDFGSLTPLEAATMWEETRVEPIRFVRLLSRDGLIDQRLPEERHRAESLRDAIGVSLGKVESVRSHVRFERAGWSFTGTAALTPGERIIRVALRGSKPCNISGRAAIASLTLKGRLFEDTSSKAGLKVQVLEHLFESQGCQLTLRTQVNSLSPLRGGGEVRVSGSLNLQIRGEVVTGRLQLDLVSRDGGTQMQTGRAVFNLRGKVTPEGNLQANLVPVSTSGSKEYRDGLNEPGTITGTVKLREGSGQIQLSLFSRPIDWRGRGLD